MLDKVKILLGIKDEAKDGLINLLIEEAMLNAMSICHLNEYDKKLDSAILKMVVQDYNRLGFEGISSHNHGGVSESFAEGYSKDIMTILNKHKRVRFL